MFNLFKAQTGTEKINKIVGTFTDTLVQLEEAVQQVQDEITSNQNIVEELKAQNTLLGATKVTGLKLIAGIKRLLGRENGAKPA